MDTQSQKLFDELVAKQPHELLETDIAFLRARESYLTAEQRKRFKDVLATEDEPADEEPSKPSKK